MFYAYDNTNAKYNPYYEDSGNYNYNDIPTEFNRTLNVLVYL
jgi:hypothetical protein